jgi:hypothetical protein
MRTLLLTAAVTVLLWGAVPAYAQQASGTLSADDFLTEAQGGSTEIEVKGDVVTAETIEKAADKAAELTQNYRADAPAVMELRSKDGRRGVLASGKASYDTNATHPNAKNNAIRHAYIKAFMEAKQNLTQWFNGLNVDNRNDLIAEVTRIGDDDKSLSVREEFMGELIRERGEGFIQGFEVRSVKDVEEHKAIVVTIIVTAETLGKSSRSPLTPVVVDSVDFRTGLTQVLDEIKKGILLPAGGRVIRTDQGPYFIGYGSALVGISTNSAMRAELLNDARRAALARARDSLMGLLSGDKMTWEYRLQETHTRLLQEFIDLSGADAMTDTSPEGIAQLADLKSEVLSHRTTSSGVQSVRSGRLPPGTTERSFVDDKGVWYYAVVVYNPAASQAAADLGREMREATLIQPIRETPRQGGATGNTSRQSNTVRPNMEVQMIPTGSFGNDDDE